MIVFKKIFHILFSSFLIWQTFMLVERLIKYPPMDFSDQFIDAVLVNIFVTGIFTIVYSFPVYRLLPVKYYQIRQPELLKVFGHIIQIELFRKLLTLTIWDKKQNKKYFFSGFRSGFHDLETATMKSEFGHFMSFCIVMVLVMAIGINKDFLLALMVLVINLFFNFYPFMLQRFHRLRLDEIRSKFVVCNN